MFNGTIAAGFERLCPDGSCYENEKEMYDEETNMTMARLDAAKQAVNQTLNNREIMDIINTTWSETREALVKFNVTEDPIVQALDELIVAKNITSIESIVKEQVESALEILDAYKEPGMLWGIFTSFVEGAKNSGSARKSERNGN